MICPKCKSVIIIKFGQTVRRDGWYQRYVCKDCRHIFLGDKLGA